MHYDNEGRRTRGDAVRWRLGLLAVVVLVGWLAWASLGDPIWTYRRSVAHTSA